MGYSYEDATEHRSYVAWWLSAGISCLVFVAAISRSVVKNSADDLNSAINVVYERTGQVPEVETAEDLANVLVNWGEALAAENQKLKRRVEALEASEREAG